MCSRGSLMVQHAAQFSAASAPRPSADRSRPFSKPGAGRCRDSEGPHALLQRHRPRSRTRSELSRNFLLTPEKPPLPSHSVLRLTPSASRQPRPLLRTRAGQTTAPGDSKTPAEDPTALDSGWTPAEAALKSETPLKSEVLLNSKVLAKPNALVKSEFPVKSEVAALNRKFGAPNLSFASAAGVRTAEMTINDGSRCTVIVDGARVSSYRAAQWHGGQEEVLYCVGNDEGGEYAEGWELLQGGLVLSFPAFGGMASMPAVLLAGRYKTLHLFGCAGCTALFQFRSVESVGSFRVQPGK